EGAQMPWAKRNSPLAWAGCVIWPYFCVRLSGATYSQRKWRQVEDDSVAALDPKVRTLGDRVADLSTDQTVQSLPDRLTALWEQGRPLAPGSPRLETPADRRRALYEYWASRTDTAWGQEVKDAVEAFCRAVVQTSDTPFTEDELRAYRDAHPEQPFLAPKA